LGSGSVRVRKIIIGLRFDIIIIDIPILDVAKRSPQLTKVSSGFLYAEITVN
jgi:hypothetical protein